MLQLLFQGKCAGPCDIWGGLDLERKGGGVPVKGKVRYGSRPAPVQQQVLPVLEQALQLQSRSL